MKRIILALGLVLTCLTVAVFADPAGRSAIEKNADSIMTILAVISTGAATYAGYAFKVIKDLKNAIKEIIDAATIIRDRVKDVVVLKEVHDAFEAIAKVLDDIKMKALAAKLRSIIY